MPNVTPLATLAVRAALWPWGWGSPATTTTTSTSLIPTSTVEPKTAWVTVNREHEATTITPAVTTISGTPTTVSGIPYHLTGTIFTTTVHLEISTSTGSAVPTANKHGEGSFIRCHKPDSADNPFCLPTKNQTLHAGINYFVTWDTSYQNKTSSKIRIKGYYDAARNEQAFESEKIDPTRGFYQWTFWKELYQQKNPRGGIPIYLQLSFPKNETSKEIISIPGPVVQVNPKFKRAPHHPTDPTGKALYIGLPSFFGFLLLMVLGISFCNRKVRRIGIGNVMTRSRRYLGKTTGGRFGSRSKSRKGGRKNQDDKEQGVPLMERERDSNEYQRDW